MMPLRRWAAPTSAEFVFYGTLIAGHANPAARLVARQMRCLGPTRLRGRLYVIPDMAGWYPALVPGEGVVWGMRYVAPPGFDVAALDAYEGADYRRVRMGGAWVYVWREALPRGARRISRGDFAAWLAQGRRRAFGEAG